MTRRSSGLLGGGAEALRRVSDRAGGIDPRRPSRRTSRFESRHAGSRAYVLRLHRPDITRSRNSSRNGSGFARWRTRVSRCRRRCATRDGREYATVSIARDRRTPLRGSRALDRRRPARRACCDTPTMSRDPGLLRTARRDRGGDARSGERSGAYPAAFKRHALDADGLMGEAPFWGRFWEHPALRRGRTSAAASRRATRIRAALMRYRPPRVDVQRDPRRSALRQSARRTAIV